MLSFLNAARKGNDELAALYLNTSKRGNDATELASQLAVVLNRLLPARLNEISSKPEGSLEDLLHPDEDLVGTISLPEGELKIVVERVDRGQNGKIWLFSRETLASIPDVFNELNPSPAEEFVHALETTRIATIPLYEWLAVFLGMPLFYLLMGVFSRVLGSIVGALRRRLTRNAGLQNPQLSRPAIRLLLLALAIRWIISKVPLPLLARQFWSTTALIITVAASIWLVMLLNRWIERYLVRRIRRFRSSTSVVRLFRWAIDGFLIVAGLLFTLHHFDIDATAALAGLGVGGIAVALAAQKTLENVIAGVSLVADQALRVGDFVNLGDLQGTVEEVGLRSTRIRTLERTLASLPNSQIAGMRLEIVSARDKFWFHPPVGVDCDATPAQLRSIVAGIRNLLIKQPTVETASVRVSFLRFGAYSLDVDIFAYVLALNWNEFLEIQEQLLLEIMEIIEEAGTWIARPSQILYLPTSESDGPLRSIRWRPPRPPSLN